MTGVSLIGAKRGEPNNRPWARRRPLGACWAHWTGNRHFPTCEQSANYSWPCETALNGDEKYGEVKFLDQHSEAKQRSRMRNNGVTCQGHVPSRGPTAALAGLPRQRDSPPMAPQAAALSWEVMWPKEPPRQASYLVPRMTKKRCKNCEKMSKKSCK